MSYDFRGPNEANQPDSVSAATLQIEVPHWAATVRLYNNLHQLVWYCSSLTPKSESPPIYVADATLPPGIYQVEAALEGRAERKVVSLRPGRPKQIKWDEWKSLKPASIAPRAGTLTSHAPQTSAAEEWSRKTTWQDAQGGTSRLFIFVRTAKPDRNKSFAAGLSLLDSSGNTVTDFSDSVEKSAEAGWMAFNASLPPGCYVLKRERSDANLHCIPLYLCDGWETQVFVPARSSPSLRSLTLNLARYGGGYRADDESTSTVETVLETLRSGSSGKHLVASEKLTTLLRGKSENPWLGILAAYVLLRSGARDPLMESTVDDEPQLSSLFDELVHNLSQTAGVRDHPDVRALQLKFGEVAAKAFPHPPLLLAGLQRVQSHSVTCADTIPFRSLTDSIVDNVLANSVWTAWRHLERTPSNWNEVSTTAPPPTARSRRIAQKQANDFLAGVVIQGPISKGPVYQFPQGSRSRKTRGEISPAEEQEILNPLFGVALLQKVSELTNNVGSSGLPEVVSLNVSQVFDDLINSIVPKEASQMLDLPLSRVEHGLESLREAGTGFSKGTHCDAHLNLTPSARAVLEYALTNAVAAGEGRSSSSKAADPSADEGLAADAPAETPAEGIAHLSIEEFVNKLLAEAAGLKAKIENKQVSDEYGEQALKLAERLQVVANHLLKYAEFIVVTDIDQQMLYANGAFTKLLTQPYGETSATAKPREEVEEAWLSLLESAPTGVSTVQSPLPGLLFEDWELRRSVVEEESSHTTRAYLDVLRGKNIPSLSSSLKQKLAKLLPSLSLYAASFGAGDRQEGAASGDRLERLVSELEEIVNDPLKGEKK